MRIGAMMKTILPALAHAVVFDRRYAGDPVVSLEGVKSQLQVCVNMDFVLCKLYCREGLGLFMTPASLEWHRHIFVFSYKPLYSRQFCSFMIYLCVYKQFVTSYPIRVKMKLHCLVYYIAGGSSLDCLPC